MDIDVIEDPEYLVSSAKVYGKKPSFVPIDDAHPFDLESYISAYAGTNIILHGSCNWL